MRKIEFKNKIFEYSLIGYLILLLCWNLYALDTGNLFGIIPIGIQGILLFLIFTKNEYAKIGIKIWAIILILSNGLSFAGKSIKILLGDEIIITEFISKVIFLAIGILIYVFNEKFVEFINSEKLEISKKKKIKSRNLSPELIKEAKKHPNGWVYVLDKEYERKEDVPSEFIKGAWKVNEKGEIIGEFEKNPNYHKK